jgi:hypothetical protein
MKWILIIFTNNNFTVCEKAILYLFDLNLH